MLLYETENQFFIFLMVLIIGFLCGIIFDANRYISFLCNKNKVVQFVLDITSVFLCFCVFYAVNIKLNYGQIRLYLILSFALGIILERTTLGLLIAKISKLCYAKFRLTINKLIKTKEKHEINKKS